MNLASLIECSFIFGKWRNPGAHQAGRFFPIFLQDRRDWMFLMTLRLLLVRFDQCLGSEIWSPNKTTIVLNQGHRVFKEGAKTIMKTNQRVSISCV